MILKIFAAIAKTIGILVTITLLTPIAFFAWRATEPMSMSEFQDRSYIQFLNERRNSYADLAHTYQASHQNVNVKKGICFGSELAVEMTFSFPVSGIYTLAAEVSSIKSRLNPRAISLGLVPRHVTALSFLPTWWGTFEKMVWGLSEHVPQGAVAYCRIAMP